VTPADLEHIAQALGGARRDGDDSWTARCPAHADKHASLALTVSEGRLLWFCRAGCDQDAVTDALRAQGLLPGRGNGSAGPASTKREGDEWRPVMPVPDNAAEPAFDHFRHGAPSCAWTYRDCESRVLFYVARFDGQDGGKEVLPRCYGSMRGKVGWFWKAPPEPRPLYRLHELAVRPDSTPVLLVEGEKTAVSAAKLIADHACLTWQGGSKAVAKADWSPLQGRNVVVWPDADDPGRKAARQVGNALREIAATVRIVDPPASLPKGWDLADAVPDGIDVRALLEHAMPYDATADQDQEEGQPPEGVCITGGSLAKNVRTAEQLLAQASRDDPPTGIYQRGGLLVRIVHLPEPTTAGGIKRAAGSQQILAAASDYLRLRLTEITPWLKYDARAKKWRQIDAPAEVARTLTEIAGMWPNTPSLAGIVQAPTLRPDGSILARPGYDETTGLYFDPGVTDFPGIPERPTQRDAEAARDLLLEFIAGFPFTDDASMAVAIAMMITPQTRHAVRAAPLTGVSAPKMASGKTLLSHLPAYIATGRSPALISQADDPQEEKKRLLALLLEGSVVSVIDNCERPLRSDALCTVLTESTMRDRILGATRTITVPTNTTWIATGNNLLIDGDLSSRALLCSLDPRCERPEEREFAVDLHAEVPKRRGELAAATLTITRAYLAAGAPRQNILTFGRFESWSRYVREPLVWLGMTDPCKTIQKIRAKDWTRNALGNLLDAWHDTFDATPQTVKVAVQVSETNEPLRAALETVGLDRGKLNARKIGNFLAKHEGRIERGYCAAQAEQRQGVALWSVGYAGYVGSSPTHVANCQEQRARTRARENDTYAESAGTNPPNPPNPPNGHAGRDPVGTCAHCQKPIFHASGYSATSCGKHLHNACVDAWSRV
jgi:putative DNA primase/helicase